MSRALDKSFALNKSFPLNKSFALNKSFPLNKSFARSPKFAPYSINDKNAASNRFEAAFFCRTFDVGAERSVFLVNLDR